MELDARHAGELRRKLPVGTVLQALVTDVRPDGKVRLSQSRAEAEQLKSAARTWIEEQEDESGAAVIEAKVGTFGELLKEKLGL